jgi:hypothetical protein
MLVCVCTHLHVHVYMLEHCGLSRAIFFYFIAVTDETA